MYDGGEYPLKELELADNYSGFTDEDTNQENIPYNCEDIKEEADSSNEDDFIIELIEVYRTLPALWERSSKDYQNKKIKKKQFNILFTKYREIYPYGDKDDFMRTITNIRSNYLKDCERITPHSKTPDESQNSMLDLEEIEVTANPAIEKFTRPDSVLNDAQFIKLSTIYKKHLCLWDERDVTYRFANRRREAVQKILEEFNKKCGLNLQKDVLEKEILQMRRVCSSEKREKLRCERNKTTYKRLCPYYHHIAYLEVDVGPLECEMCGKLLGNPGRYKTHVASHDDSLPFKCNICGRSFQLGTNLTVHLRRHVHDYTYSCKVCNKPIATTTELKIHMRSHTGEKPYVCEICGRNFQRSGEFREHMQRHEKRPRYKCEHCPRAFYNRPKLKEHMSVHLQIRDQICDICNKGFTTRKQLRQHKHIHDVEKKFLCKICGKRFSQSAGLSGHMKSHGMSLAAKDACLSDESPLTPISDIATF